MGTGQPGEPISWDIPSGVRDLLPGGAQRFFTLREAFLASFRKWGYRPVLPPFMEFADTFSAALPESASDDSTYKLVDRQTGQVLAIRPDFTPQIARIVASRFREAPAPLRLCYAGPVARHTPAGTGRPRLMHHAGAELLGVSSPDADGEGIALLIECLMSSGLRDFRVDVGQVEFFRGILQDVHLHTEKETELVDCVTRKDISGLEKLLEDNDELSPKKKKLLAELPLLAGGYEVIELAEKLVETEHSSRALQNLARTVRVVDMHGMAEYLTIDLGEIRGIDYHTGVVYEAFMPHLGMPLSKGGRYDKLIDTYGKPMAATGFSAHLLAILEALELQDGGSIEPLEGVFVINLLDDPALSVRVAGELRAAGIRVARELIPRPREEATSYGLAQRFEHGVVLGDPNVGETDAIVVELSTGLESTVALDRLVDTLG